MNKRKLIAYWIITIFMAFGTTAGAIQQTFQIGGYNEVVTGLGYPLYLLSIIGIWKLLGVLTILIPGFLLAKEWAYAGFFFVMSGAFLSHLIIGQPFVEAIPSLTLLIATVLSWSLRPENRKLAY